MMNKIVYVGNFKPQHSTENHLAATLEVLRYRVLRIQEDEIQAGTLLRDIDNFEPDMFLWTRTWPGHITDDLLTKIKNLNIPTVSYHLDLYVPISRRAAMADDPFWRTDFVFTPDGDPGSAEVFKQMGINHHYLKPGVFKPECVEGKWREEYAYNVIFIGRTVNYHDEWPYRERLANFLKATYGGWYRSYGHPYKTVRNQELNDVLASAKVVVGDTLCPGFTHEGYWSDRIYETTGRGGFMIHPRIKGLETEFENDKEVAFYNYGDFDHLKQLIDWYLEHDAYREKVRKAGMERTIRDHTYNNRLEEMFEVINAAWPNRVR